MSILEKAAYLRGLFEGMNLDPEQSNEAKILSTIIDLFEDIGKNMEDIGDEIELLSNGIDAVSDDLADVEEFFFGEDDFDDMDELDLNEEIDPFEVKCPNCNEDIVIDTSVFNSGVVECPNCHSTFSFDVRYEDDDDFEEEEEDDEDDED